MTRYVRSKDVFNEMAKHTFPRWAKLALSGAVLTEQISLYAAKGHIRTYVSKYDFPNEKSSLPPLKKESEILSFIARYELDATTAVDNYVTAWSDEWSGEPKRLAVGWSLWHEPLDWGKPVLSHEFFQIEGSVEAFAYDDIFYEGEPETAPYYDAKFEDLCFELSDAEALAPMANLEGFAFEAATDLTSRPIGRPPGTGFAASDRPLVEQIRADLEANPNASLREVASRYADQAIGGGTHESKIRRLERRLRRES